MLLTNRNIVDKMAGSNNPAYSYGLLTNRTRIALDLSDRGKECIYKSPTGEDIKVTLVDRDDDNIYLWTVRDEYGNEYTADENKDELESIAQYEREQQDIQLHPQDEDPEIELSNNEDPDIELGPTEYNESNPMPAIAGVPDNQLDFSNPEEWLNIPLTGLGEPNPILHIRRPTNRNVTKLTGHVETKWQNANAPKNLWEKIWGTPAPDNVYIPRVFTDGYGITWTITSGTVRDGKIYYPCQGIMPNGGMFPRNIVNTVSETRYSNYIANEIDNVYHYVHDDKATSREVADYYNNVLHSDLGPYMGYIAQVFKTDPSRTINEFMELLGPDAITSQSALRARLSELRRKLTPITSSAYTNHIQDILDGAMGPEPVKEPMAQPDMIISNVIQEHPYNPFLDEDTIRAIFGFHKQGKTADQIAELIGKRDITEQEKARTTLNEKYRLEQYYRDAGLLIDAADVQIKNKIDYKTIIRALHADKRFSEIPIDAISSIVLTMYNQAGKPKLSQINVLNRIENAGSWERISEVLQEYAKLDQGNTSTPIKEEKVVKPRQRKPATQPIQPNEPPQELEGYFVGGPFQLNGLEGKITKITYQDKDDRSKMVVYFTLNGYKFAYSTTNNIYLLLYADQGEPKARYHPVKINGTVITTEENNTIDFSVPYDKGQATQQNSVPIAQSESPEKIYQDLFGKFMSLCKMNVDNVLEVNDSIANELKQFGLSDDALGKLVAWLKRRITEGIAYKDLVNLMMSKAFENKDITNVNIAMEAINKYMDSRVEG